MRPIGCTESWVAYLARCARQRRCREAPPVVAGQQHNLFADAAGRLLGCGMGVAAGHGDDDGAVYPGPTVVAAMAGVRVRSIAVGSHHSLALGWDGRVYSWGWNHYTQLGHGDELNRNLPTLVEGLEAVRGIAAHWCHSHALTQSGALFSWGRF
jgi:alpha-tubulin suppressor-like RCC1 family protein